MPFKRWPERKWLNVKFQIDLTPIYFYFLLLSQLGVGPCFYSVFRHVSLGSQARKEFLGSRGGIGKSLNWRIGLLFPLVSSSCIPGHNVSKFMVLWDRLEQPKVLRGPQDGEGESCAIPGQTGCLGTLSPTSLY